MVCPPTPYEWYTPSDSDVDEELRLHVLDDLPQGLTVRSLRLSSLWRDEPICLLVSCR